MGWVRGGASGSGPLGGGGGNTTTNRPVPAWRSILSRGGRRDGLGYMDGIQQQEANRTASEESLRGRSCGGGSSNGNRRPRLQKLTSPLTSDYNHHRGGSRGGVIQMDMITTVVVELDDDRFEKEAGDATKGPSQKPSSHFSLTSGRTRGGSGGSSVADADGVETLTPV